MKYKIASFIVATIIAASCSQKDASLIPESVLAEVETMSLELSRQGFNAGSGYTEVWVRDFNTFIELSMETMPDSVIRRNLDVFFAFQGTDGNIVDGFAPRQDAFEDYDLIASEYEPDFLAHKNTVETDQESSLIQAVHKYVVKSGNRAYLQEVKYGESVYSHLKRAIGYLSDCKMDPAYGLLTGGTTCDWGDVQPESPWGVVLDDDSHICIDVYDNAMFVLALRCMADLADDEAEKSGWLSMADEISGRCRRFLWDGDKMKFRPHLYLNGSPFPSDFDEDAIFIQGGTAIAILAGMLDDAEIDASLRHMLERVIENGSFNEWYGIGGEPRGSGTFRGEAGVLYTAITMLRNS